MKSIAEKAEELFWRYYYFSPERIIAKKMKQVISINNIIDVGCGKGELLSRLKKITKYSKSSLGMDIYQPLFDNLKKKHIYTWLLIGDIRALPFKKKAFDVVIASHVVEHVEKNRTLNNLVDIARRFLIVYTPQGETKFSPHEEAEENVYQRHRSGYGIEDFRREGFCVYGIGSRLVCGRLYKEGRLPIFIRRLFSLTSMLATIFTYFFPRFADHLLCIKIMETPNQYIKE